MLGSSVSGGEFTLLARLDVQAEGYFASLSSQLEKNAKGKFPSFSAGGNNMYSAVSTAQVNILRGSFNFNFGIENLNGIIGKCNSSDALGKIQALVYPTCDVGGDGKVFMPVKLRDSGPLLQFLLSAIPGSASLIDGSNGLETAFVNIGISVPSSCNAFEFKDWINAELCMQQRPFPILFNRLEYNSDIMGVPSSMHSMGALNPGLISSFQPSPLNQFNYSEGIQSNNSFSSAGIPPQGGALLGAPAHILGNPHGYPPANEYGNGVESNGNSPTYFERTNSSDNLSGQGRSSNGYSQAVGLYPQQPNNSNINPYSRGGNNANGGAAPSSYMSYQQQQQQQQQQQNPYRNNAPRFEESNSYMTQSHGTMTPQGSYNGGFSIQGEHQNGYYHSHSHPNELIGGGLSNSLSQRPGNVHLNSMDDLSMGNNSNNNNNGGGGYLSGNSNRMGAIPGNQGRLLAPQGYQNVPQQNPYVTNPVASGGMNTHQHSSSNMVGVGGSNMASLTGGWGNSSSSHTQQGPSGYYDIGQQSSNGYEYSNGGVGVGGSMNTSPPGNGNGNGLGQTGGFGVQVGNMGGVRGTLPASMSGSSISSLASSSSSTSLSNLNMHDNLSGGQSNYFQGVDSTHSSTGDFSSGKFDSVGGLDGIQVGGSSRTFDEILLIPDGSYNHTVSQQNIYNFGNLGMVDSSSVTSSNISRSASVESLGSGGGGSSIISSVQGNITSNVWASVAENKDTVAMSVAASVLDGAMSVNVTSTSSSSNNSSNASSPTTTSTSSATSSSSSIGGNGVSGSGNSINSSNGSNINGDKSSNAASSSSAPKTSADSSTTASSPNASTSTSSPAASLEQKPTTPTSFASAALSNKGSTGKFTSSTVKPSVSYSNSIKSNLGSSSTATSPNSSNSISSNSATNGSSGSGTSTTSDKEKKVVATSNSSSAGSVSPRRSTTTSSSSTSSTTTTTSSSISSSSTQAASKESGPSPSVSSSPPATPIVTAASVVAAAAANSTSNKEPVKETTTNPAAPGSPTAEELQSAEVRDGDWNCPSCQGHNFATKIACFTCHKPRPGFESGIPGDKLRNLNMGRLGGPQIEAKPGDWTCPRCNEIVFAKRTRCYRCSASKSGR